MTTGSSSDRIGALHFQEMADQYIPREENKITLEQLAEAAMLVELGKPIPAELNIALNHGTSIGGARPKATIDSNNKKFIAKFSSSTDVFPIVQAEYAVMSLAKKVGLEVANVDLTKVKEKYILLVERFDREKLQNQWSRKMMTSALTLLNLDEMQARYASYLDLADIIRKYSEQPIKQLRELFQRMVFNIIVGNTDDHAKNHAFFWDGKHYQLTPAYDICPYPRAGQEAAQAMEVGLKGALSQLNNAKSAAGRFGISDQEAQEIIENLVQKVKKYWPIVCEQAELTSVQQKLFTHTAILNPFIFL